MEDQRSNQKLFIICTDSFEDVRCTSCNALLFKALKKSKQSPETIQIKCHRCGAMRSY